MVIRGGRKTHILCPSNPYVHKKYGAKLTMKEFRMFDIIKKKQSGFVLGVDEINYVIKGYINELFPDYQMAAFLMAVYFEGMEESELLNFTMAMVNSGNKLDLSGINGIKADKHSTGGVGDKTTLIVCPIVAACGIKIAKMSGRSLGYTGGTIDKLESIPGYDVFLSKDEFFEVVDRVGISIISQTDNLVPADKKIYALRDVTSTVENVHLIASSIMSKKIATGSDYILLDVKVGSGAFMKNIDDALHLSQLMVNIGEMCGKKTKAILTDMDVPLGNAIGNSLEIREVIDTLNGNGPEDITELCLELAANMISLVYKYEHKDAKEQAKKNIQNGKALEKFDQMLKAHHVSEDIISDPQKLGVSKECLEIKSAETGYIQSIQTEKCGIAAALLGAGRKVKNSTISYTAGIVLHKKISAFVNKGETIATFYADNKQLFEPAEEIFLNSITISSDIVKSGNLIKGIVEANNIQVF